jgi:predicted RNase H-like nuclease (RuvC/YqgF family)
VADELKEKELKSKKILDKYERSKTEIKKYREEKTEFIKKLNLENADLTSKVEELKRENSVLE